jgi:serine phosphatase RsbU (regulator of sigma subunit)
MIISEERITALPATGALLGVLQDATWTSSVVKLRSGDRLILFTDGVVEAGAPSQPWGLQGLERVLRASSNLSLPDQMTHVVDEAEKRCIPRACDDITLVGFEVLPGNRGGQYYAI